MLAVSDAGADSVVTGARKITSLSFFSGLSMTVDRLPIMTHYRHVMPKCQGATVYIPGKY